MPKAVYVNNNFTLDNGDIGHMKSFSDENSISFKKSGACGGRTRLECALLLLAVLLTAAVIGLIIAFVLEVNKKDEPEEFCETADCAMSVARILDSIDMTTDPCDDFYQFACGGWRRQHVIPEDKSSQTVFNLVREDVQVTVKYLLEESNNYDDVEAVQKVKNLYQSCIDTALIEEKNYTVTLPLLEELGGWPSLGANPGGNWGSNSFNMVDLLVKLRSYNNRPIVDIYVSSDVKDSDNHVIYIDSPAFVLPGRLYYLNNDTKTMSMREAYVKLGRSVLELFGADPMEAENDMRDIIDLETDLANITMPSEDRRDNEKLYNKMDITEITANFTRPSDVIQFSYLDFIQSVMSIKGVEIPVNESEHVVVRDTEYFNRLPEVLGRHGNRTIANYLVWYIMFNRIRNLPSRFTDLVTDYNQVISGAATARARWRECEAYAVGQMGMAIGHMFVKEAFDESSKAVALDMINNIREAFNLILDELDWMDEETKVLARDKAEAMREWIGYPDDILQLDDLNKLYENITQNATEYFENVLGNLRQSSIDGLKNLRKKYDKNVWTTAPSTVNAFYNPIQNIIMFPAGILQPPFYSRDQPKSMNFGGIGMVIGHEITHGFDDRGRQYDKEGNLADWWDEAIITKFKEKAQCIVDQYSAFEMPDTGIHINGINTQGENIADNGGLKQSFRAYRKWVDSQGKEEPRLPGLNFTHNQLFFINFAQVWCNNMRTEAVISSINTGVHSPGQFRVIGPLRNSMEFAEAFSCPNTKYMNPPNKCSVW